MKSNLSDSPLWLSLWLVCAKETVIKRTVACEKNLCSKFLPYPGSSSPVPVKTSDIPVSPYLIWACIP